MNKIHIGYPKTATTSLQKQVFPYLKNHIFIDHKEFHKNGLIDLVWQADRSVNYEKLKELYNNNELDHFVSFENLVGPLYQGSILIDTMPARLANVFGKRSKILITIRKQDDILKSVYYQYIHQGGTMSFRSFLLHPQNGNNKIDLNAFDFYETYIRYCNEFGESNVTVIPMEFLFNNREKFNELLIDFFGNEQVDIRDLTKENSSLLGYQLKVLRLINRFVKSRLSESFIIHPKLINQDKLRYKWQKSNFLRFGKSLSLDEEQLVKNQLNYYKENNQKLSNKLNLSLDNLGYF